MARRVLLSAVSAAFAGSAFAAGHITSITYSGYLLDWACWNRTLDGMGAPDGSNVIAGPSAHYTGCLLLDGDSAPAQCKAGGYYLAQSCGGSDNYHPKFDLSQDAVSHANAVAFIESIHSVDPREIDIKVTVTAMNHHGVLMNATFERCTGMNCDGVCGSDTCEGLADEECSPNTITYSGYIIDWWCYDLMQNNMSTPDGSNVLMEPWNHSTGCLVGPEECRQGYYLAMKDSEGVYHPYLALNHSTSHATVLAFLQAMHTNSPGKDIAVTVSGYSDMGSIMNAEITECSYRGDMGSVTDGVFMGARGCDGVCTGNCACTLMDQSGCVATTTTTTAAMSDGMSDDSVGFAAVASAPGIVATFAGVLALASTNQ